MLELSWRRGLCYACSGIGYGAACQCERDEMMYERSRITFCRANGVES